MSVGKVKDYVDEKTVEGKEGGAEECDVHEAGEVVLMKSRRRRKCLQCLIGL